MNDGKVRDFEHLEGSLRKFVLGNRAKWKLAPARTYLLNILHDIHSLAAAKGINAVTQLGIMHGGDSNAFETLHFRSEAMFSRKRVALVKQVDIPIELRDFVE